MTSIPTLIQKTSTFGADLTKRSYHPKKAGSMHRWTFLKRSVFLMTPDTFIHWTQLHVTGSVRSATSFTASKRSRARRFAITFWLLQNLNWLHLNLSFFLLKKIMLLLLEVMRWQAYSVFRLAGVLQKHLQNLLTQRSTVIFSWIGSLRRSRSVRIDSAYWWRMIQIKRAH